MESKTSEVTTFDINDLDAIDQADMVILAKGRPTNWVWTFAGPGHPKAVALSNRLSRERLRKEAEQEQARVNGKKWKAEQDSVDELARQNADIIVERLLGWSSVQMAGEDYPCTPENARKLLLDPKKGSLALQALEFIGDQNSFLQRSSTT
jgi:hypothetical protein